MNVKMNYFEFKVKNYFFFLLIYLLYYNILMVELYMVILWLIYFSCGRIVDYMELYVLF